MIIDTYSDFAVFLRDLANQRAVAFDTETSGLKIWHGDRICGLAFGFEDGRNYYIPVRHRTEVPEVVFVKDGRRKVRTETGNWINQEFRQLEPEQVIPRIFDVIRNNGIELRTHNGKFDLHMVENEGVDTDGIKVYDTMIMGRLYNNIELNYKLKPLGKKYVDPNARDDELELKKILIKRGWKYKTPEGEDIMHMDWLTPAEVASYAETDVALTNGLYNFYRRAISQEHMIPVLEREAEFLHVVVAMERYGWRVDLDYCRMALDSINPRISELAESIFALVGYDFDLASGPSLGKAMMKLGIKAALTTETGRESWAKKSIQMNDHPVVAMVLEWRGLTKLRSTYLENYIRLCDPDGIIHPSIEQAEAKTGRTSSRDPNIQNVTGEEKYGFKMRGCFIPRPGMVLVFIDWSQMELRIMAHRADEPVLKAAIARGDDLHLLTAMRIAEVLGEEVCGDKRCPNMAKRRKWAKTIVFGLIYGMGVEKLAADLGVSEEEAEKMRTAFWKSYPKVDAYAKKIRNQASNLGWISNFYGRRYRYPLNKDGGRNKFGFGYAAVDHDIQGTGADMMKEAMNRIYRGLRKNNKQSRILSVIHDEIVFECPPGEVDWVVRKSVATMQDFPKFSVPITVEVSIATKSWSDKEEYVKTSN